MQVTCTKCQQLYQLDESKYFSRYTRFLCKKCGRYNLIKIYPYSTAILNFDYITAETYSSLKVLLVTGLQNKLNRAYNKKKDENILVDDNRKTRARDMVVTYIDWVDGYFSYNSPELTTTDLQLMEDSYTRFLGKFKQMAETIQ